MAGSTVSSTFRTAKAVLTIETLSVVRASSSTVLVLIQNRTVEISLTTFVDGFYTGCCWRGSCCCRSQNQTAVGEITLFFWFAMGERVRVPQAVGVGQTTDAVTVVITVSVTFAGKTDSLVTSEAGTTLHIGSTAPTLIRGVRTSVGVAGRQGVVAKLARPSAPSGGSTILAVVEGTSVGHRGGNNRDTLLGCVCTSGVVTRNGGIVTRSARPHTAIRASARTTIQVAASVDDHRR